MNFKLTSISPERGGGDRRLSVSVGLALCITLMGGAIAPSAHAQSVPTDLTDLSLADLMDMSVKTRDASGVGNSWFDPGRMHLSYGYLRHTFKGYRDGTKNISDGELLGPRDGVTYPILQDKIVQEAHTFGLAYAVTDRVTTRLTIPYIRQVSDHHAVPALPAEFGDFAIESDGIGDISLVGSIRAIVIDQHSLVLSAGLSFPSGSITEKGDTPSPGTRNQLPYTMQLGSGTWDIILSAGYQGHANPFEGTSLAALGPIGWGAQIFGKFRTGENHRGYRLGHRMSLSTWVSARPASWFEPFAKLSSEIWGRIHGNDQDFLTAPFPTPVADPDNFGGERLVISAGVSVRLPAWGGGAVGSALSKQKLTFEYGHPVYQSLNGPQPRERRRLSFDWSTSF